MSESSKEFDRMQEEWVAEIKVEAVKIMKEFICTPDHAFDVAKQRWERAADKKYTERQKAKDRELLAKTARELPDCPSCGHHPVVTWTSANLVKCGNRDCKLSACTFRFDEWRERAKQAKHETQYDAFVADTCRKLEEINLRLERDVDTQRRNERQRIIDGLPDCPFCGSRPVWHATSYKWVKCSDPNCRNRDAWYNPNQWRDRVAKPADMPHKAAMIFPICGQYTEIGAITGKARHLVDLLLPNGKVLYKLPVPEPYLIGQMMELTYRVKETG